MKELANHAWIIFSKYHREFDLSTMLNEIERVETDLENFHLDLSFEQMLLALGNHLKKQADATSLATNNLAGRWDQIDEILIISKVIRNLADLGCTSQNNPYRGAL